MSFETKMFTYQPAWIIGLIVIGCIIALFFIGCIFAVVSIVSFKYIIIISLFYITRLVKCYTRRPYRRSSKIYEVESTRRGGKKQIPQIPGVYPSTKASTVKSRDREFYY